MRYVKSIKKMKLNNAFMKWSTVCRLWLLRTTYMSSRLKIDRIESVPMKIS